MSIILKQNGQLKLIHLIFEIKEKVIKIEIAY
jgi:hypothetical protein